MDFAKRFWKGLFGERARVIGTLFHKFGFEVCEHVGERKVHLRDACVDCIFQSVEKILSLKVMINLKCARRLPKDGDARWTIAFFPFNDEKIHVDLYECTVDTRRLFSDLLPKRKMVHKTPDLFGNCMELGNFSHNVDCQCVGISKNLYYFLAFVFLLDEVNRSKNKEAQTNVALSVIEAYFPSENKKKWTREAIINHVNKELNALCE